MKEAEEVQEAANLESPVTEEVAKVMPSRPTSQTAEDTAHQPKKLRKTRV